MKIQYFFLIIVLFIGLTACEKNDVLLNDGLLKSATITKSDNLSNYTSEEIRQMYNSGLHEFAEALARSLKSRSLRKSIKEDALLKLDGDFDVIWKSFKDKEIDGESVIKRLAKDVSKTKSEDDKLKSIESFSNLFKQLQISVPILVDKWNIDSQIPVVAFREVNKDGVSDFLFTYDKDGKQGRIEKEIIPDYPVLVVNLNERSDEEGNILTEYNRSFQTMLKSARLNPLLNLNSVATEPAPYDFQGQYINNYIILSWVYDYYDANEHYIQIERENGTGFQLIDEIYTSAGSNNYLDYSVQLGNNYAYRIRAKIVEYGGTTIYSGYTPSIIISTGATGIPITPTNFSIVANNPYELQLTWDYPTTANITGFKLSKRIVGSGQNFDTPILLSSNNRFYLDLSSKTVGQKYQYKLIAYNSISESGEALDVCYVPYRTHTDHLYIKQLDFPDLNGHDIETWDLGDPEIRITVTQKETPTSAVNMIAELVPIYADVILKPRSSDHSYNDASYYFSTGVGVLGGTWEPDFYKSVINVNYIEHDGYNWLTGWKDITISVKVPIKIGGADISISGSTTITNSVKNTEYNIGDAYVAYWDPCPMHVVQVYNKMFVTYSNQP